MEADPSLETQLVAALQAGDRDGARAIATQLHARGFEAAQIDAALRQHPELEEQLFAVLQEVLPIPRRAARRRAIRAAEARDWGDWPEGRKPSK